MKIQNTNLITVDEIECGGIFFYKSEFFIKIQPIEAVVAICLEDGFTYSRQYFGNDKVTRYPSATLLI